MKERPILFSGEMVRRILDGSKTQTRREIKGTFDIASFPTWPCGGGPTALGGHGPHEPPRLPGGFHYHDANGFNWGELSCRHGNVGDRLWVRETFYCDDYRYPDGPVKEMRDLLEYRADHDCRNWEAGCPCSCDGARRRSAWRPSIHMPRWASRIDLEITGVRVERLQDISEEDARAEGCKPSMHQETWTAYDTATEGYPTFYADPTGREGLENVRHHPEREMSSARDAFRTLWLSINGLESWDANPWTWVLNFKRAAPPTDGGGG